jgi:ATP-binding cassette, subfamily B, bacterial
MSGSAAAIAAHRDGALRRGAGLVRALVRRHPRPFIRAVLSAAVFGSATVASSWALGRVTDKAIVPRFTTNHIDWGAVLWALAVLVGVGLIRALAVVARRSNASRTQMRVEHSLRLDVIDHYHAQPLGWFDRHPTGELLARAHADAEAATQVLGPLPYASGVVVLLIVSTAWLLVTDVTLGLCAVALFPLLVAINVIYQRQVEPAADRAQERIGDVSAVVHESLDGIMVVKAFGAEARETERLAVRARRLRDSQLEVALMRANFEMFLDGVPALATVALVFGGAWRVQGGAMTVGQVVAFVNLFTLLVWPLRLIGFVLGDLPRSLAGHSRIVDLLGGFVPPSALAPIAEAAPGDAAALVGVTFSYEPGRKVLRDIDLVIPAGRTIAVVGATGSGKSTLLSLLAGLHVPDQGTVAVAGGTAHLVFQETFLFAESVRDNITLGLDISDGELWDALEAAQAAEFVAALPDGVATGLGERGVTLSGGQRQRLAMARAFVRHPRLLLLDDCTSALDPTTEGRIISALDARRIETTTVMVAARPSTIAVADEVIFVDHGRIVGHAPHRELFDQFASYRHLVEAYERERSERP